jgi:Type IV secretion-system coupling protein DNA-binding domain
VARVAIESQAAPAAQGPIENHVQDLGALLALFCALVALADPGVLLGAAVAGGWRWLHRPTSTRRVICALLAAAPLLALHSFVLCGWPWRAWLVYVLPQLAPVDEPLALRSLYAEALAGPLWFEATVAVALLRNRRVDAQVRRDHRLDQRRWRAISGRRQPMSAPDPHTRTERSHVHPRGAIRLGLDAETNRALDLELPVDVAAHVFLPGASGSGKTTTVVRLADGALANGYGVVIVDAKVGGLGAVARQLAEKYGVPFNVVDPDNPDSLGYNPCTGDAASVANKLVGAFTYGPAAEIYKNIAMEAVPVVVRGLQAAEQPVTLDALYDAFRAHGMRGIARQLPADDRTRVRLLDFDDEDDRTTSSGRAGLQRRIGALLEGKFGNLFRTTPTLDWERAFAEPSVTYIALSTMASSEDVELMGRVIAQDLKQACARRLRQIAAGDTLVPVLAIFDEFAALREAEQLADLLLQARQALMPTVVATQYLPETTALRKACLAAGLLIAHRVGADDAEAIAAEFGTRRATDVTQQIDYETGYSEKGSVRRVDKYNVHPNELRSFATGQAAYKSVPKQRYTIVRVYKE